MSRVVPSGDVTVSVQDVMLPETIPGAAAVQVKRTAYVRSVTLSVNAAMLTSQLVSSSGVDGVPVVGASLSPLPVCGLSVRRVSGALFSEPSGESPLPPPPPQQRSEKERMGRQIEVRIREWVFMREKMLLLV